MMEVFEDQPGDGQQISQDILDLAEECLEQSINAPQNDEGIKSFSRAVLRLLNFPEYAAQIEFLLENLHKIKGPTSASYKHNKLLRSFQFEAIDDPDYPYRTDVEYLKELMKILDDPRNDSFNVNFLTRDVASNIAERYKAFELIMLMMQERLGSCPTVLDIGCSVNHGLLKMNSKRFGFGEVDVVKRSFDPDGTQKIDIDQELKHKANALLASKYILGKCIGIDILAGKSDPYAQRWAESCSFYPFERLVQKLLIEYYGLSLENPINVGTYQADFSKMDLETFKAHAYQDRFDVITFSTIMYQLNEDERLAMLEKAKQLVKPNGLIIIQDFCHLDPDNPNNIIFEENWFKAGGWKYTTIVIDMLNQGVMEEYFRWNNGRCGQVELLSQNIIQLLKDAPLKAA